MASLLLDEMFSGAIAEQLRAKGHDVIAVVADPALVGLSDDQILAHATDTRRALVTANIKDFILLDARYRAANQVHAGLILSRRRPSPRTAPTPQPSPPHCPPSSTSPARSSPATCSFSADQTSLPRGQSVTLPHEDESASSHGTIGMSSALCHASWLTPPETWRK